MNKIDRLMQEEPERKLLSLYFCAGDPGRDSAGEILRAMEAEGIDMAEVGIPFSDPMADGPVIQGAATRALRNGMSLDLLLRQVGEVAPGLKMPVILMGYLNPILQMGYETFFRRGQEAGVSGVIIPDLPFDEYEREVREVAERYEQRVIMLITPETTEARVREIDENTGGFIYMVSSAAVTGAQQSFSEAKQAYFRRIAEMRLKNPTMVGFGISNAQTLGAAQGASRGAIIGSKFVQLLEEKGEAVEAIRELKRELGI